MLGCFKMGTFIGQQLQTLTETNQPRNRKRRSKDDKRIVGMRDKKISVEVTHRFASLHLNK